MKGIGEVLAGARARDARRKRPMRPPSLATQVAGKSVYEVIAAARRACDAMQFELGDEPQTRMLPAWERAHTPDVEAATPYLAMVRRFGAKLVRRAVAAKAKPAALEFATGDTVARSRFSQGDDGKPADAMWLTAVVLGHLPTGGRPIRATLRGGKMATRGAWRRAVADICRKPPMAYAKLSGAVMTALSRATKAQRDVRCETNYCADPGWGAAVLGFGNVTEKKHAPGGCAACGR